MSNSNEIAVLNELVGDIKILIGSLSILEKAIANKDQASRMTALDAINFRVREISKFSMSLAWHISPTNPTNPTNPTGWPTLPIDGVLLEISKPNPDAKVLHSLLDGHLETLRKMALSEILTLSIE